MGRHKPTASDAFGNPTEAIRQALKPETAAPTHSLTPWRIKSKRDEYPELCSIVSNEKNKALPFARGDSGYTVAEVDGAANAAFIVRAVNAFEPMREALKKIVEVSPANGEDVSYLIAKQALALAEAEGETK